MLLFSSSSHHPPHPLIWCLQTAWDIQKASRCQRRGVRQPPKDLEEHNSTTHSSDSAGQSQVVIV